MTRNQPGGQPSEGYQYGGNDSYGYEGQQSSNYQQRYPEENYSSEQNHGYNDYPPYPQPAAPRYGDESSTYSGSGQSYYSSNTQPYQAYSNESQPPPVPYGTRPHGSPSYNDRASSERPYEGQTYGERPYESEQASYSGRPRPQPGAHLGPGGVPDLTTGHVNPDYTSGNPEYGSSAGNADGDRGFLGAVAGGAAGGYGGHKVHHGFLGTVGGAIAGSMAENAWKKHEKEKKEEQKEAEERRRREQEAAAAYAHHGPPQGHGGRAPEAMAGNFGASSRGMRLEGSRLVAECTDVEGRGRGAEIELNDCLTNSNGRIHWQRHGNFAGSARGLQLVEDGTVLEAEAANGSGGWQWNRVWLNERITNEDGRLKMID